MTRLAVLGHAGQLRVEQRLLLAEVVGLVTIAKATAERCYAFC